MTISRNIYLVKGIVQGVGFRPFVYRLAHRFGLKGRVRNTLGGVELDVEGGAAVMEAFEAAMRGEKPALAEIESVTKTSKEPLNYSDFSICASEKTGQQDAVILPDTAVCPQCVIELFDPANRRYLYPFTTCTHCGPRYSISSRLPFDRANTAMADFAMCPECLKEYGSASDRRFHSQTNSCAACGPELALLDGAGAILAGRVDAAAAAGEALRNGGIVALRGVGGFQLLADARNEDAVQLLRRRKNRRAKPFALMVPGVEAAAQICRIGPLERELLLSPQAPIVLMQAEPACGLAPGVAPGLSLYGVMLPYSPLHHILLRDLGFALVCTSGNLADEPICVSNQEALSRLKNVADFFLLHNRSIVNGLDDSIVRVISGKPVVLRRARGFAPASLVLEGRSCLKPVLALGAHMKNTIALMRGCKVYISQHFGTLESVEACELFEREARRLPDYFGASPAGMVCDLHPDYYSTTFAERLSPRAVKVQHHYAHVLSCAAEHALQAPLLGIAWDGSGYGTDSTVWGGEFLVLQPSGGFRRAGYLRRFLLPGGEQAVREPRRAALGVLYELYGRDLARKALFFCERAFKPPELRTLLEMLPGGVASPMCSSAGRLFDAAASLAGLRDISYFEGQAAAELECSAGAVQSDPYSTAVKETAAGLVLDWGPMVEELLVDAAGNIGRAEMAMRFHCGLAFGLAQMARRIGEKQIVLTGGVFQNKLLTELAVGYLGEFGCKVYCHSKIPPNDGGISLGQLIAAVESAG